MQPITTTIKATYCDGPVRLRFTKYTSQPERMAILLDDPTSGERLATLTAHCPECALEPDEFIVKDWSENDGIPQSLIESGVLVDTGKRHSNGFIEAMICKLNPQPQEDNDGH